MFVFVTLSEPRIVRLTFSCVYYDNGVFYFVLFSACRINYPPSFTPSLAAPSVLRPRFGYILDRYGSCDISYSNYFRPLVLNAIGHPLVVSSLLKGLDFPTSLTVRGMRGAAAGPQSAAAKPPLLLI